MSVTTVFVTLVHESCCKCGVVFGLESGHQGQLLKSHGDFWCPNGHQQHYLGESDADRLKRERAEFEARLQRERVRLAAEQRIRFATERQLRAQKGATTKLRRRAAAGTCPCCQRTFQSLTRHMKDRHPDFVKAAALEPSR